MPAPTLDDLRRYAIARSLFKPTTLSQAINRLGFVQADPIRAPARAQDLILHQRVKDYRAGDLERRYRRLAVEEDCFVNYGFLPRRHLPLLHPRSPRRRWDAATEAQAREVLDYARTRRLTHPRDVQQAFDHGSIQGYWGNQLNAGTHLLDGLHYRGQLRVAHRASGTRVYTPVQHQPGDDSPATREQRAARLVDLIVQLYAPLPAPSLGYLVTLLRYGAPDLQAQARSVVRAARQRYAHADAGGQTWFWPIDENPRSRRYAADTGLRLLAPFDPVVWDRRRFELFWGWSYRFEAYTPPARRRMGHYALPVLWRQQVIGWANLKVENGQLLHQLGFATTAPRDDELQPALAQALQRMRVFLGLDEQA
ncbi:DNA glycosylase AlkZ-like family protein [Pseudoxanthomonas dokdonensis]|uniref:Cytoplasmic protein n=1 Tax=Pseudoxanthomonas dokdonensis TaxID=344882 RepID=A0A0R0CQS8_9GAMM|nr:crosslink repair DNA glycosylase YcaQ family protein [Pseudoxanthomonas dokdonensis]KRG68786.1 cytoplasmic protein [Pseudoxanthomonas dokdonensis]